MLAAFTPAFQRLVVEVTGRSLYHASDAANPPCWDWSELRGYTKKEMNHVWNYIKSSRDFWLGLSELPGSATLRMLLPDLQRWHDLYFVTSRVGKDVKWQTEQWLRLHLQYDHPTVLISAEKGLCAKALKLDIYIDDNADNVNDVIWRTWDIAEAGTPSPMPLTRVYLLDKSYNRPPGVPEQPVSVDTRVVRVKTLGEMFDKELEAVCTP